MQQWLHELASALRYTYTACLEIIETQVVWCNCRTLSVVMKQSARTCLSGANAASVITNS